jgi:hypothetical protein
LRDGGGSGSGSGSGRDGGSNRQSIGALRRPRRPAGPHSYFAYSESQSASFRGYTKVRCKRESRF